MLGQATAMLVSFSTLGAAELDAVALPTLLRERLAITRASDPCFLQPALPLVGRHIVRVIINRTLLRFRLGLHREPVGRETSGRRRQASDNTGSGGSGGLDRCATARVHGDGQDIRYIANVLLQGGSESGHICGRVRHALSTGYTVSGIAGAGQSGQGVGIVA
jgi:hypothetical protein